MNRRHGLLFAGLVVAATWCHPIVASSQVKPDFGSLDQGGMPSCLIELIPMKKSSGWIVNAGTTYTVWAAPKRTGQQFFAAAWRPSGPYVFRGKQRYIFNWDGAAHGGRLATNPEIAGTTPILSPALASLHVQNFDGKNVWSIVNPLPPGCDRNAEGHSKPDVPPIAAAARAADVSGTWTVLGGDADGVQVASVTTNGERFHATSSYTVRGKPYRWTMDGTIDRQGKVAVVMTHSYAGKIPYTFQLSRDGKRFSGADINWVRKSDVPPTATTARAVDVNGTWTVLGGDADGVQVASVTTNGERFHATSSYSARGKPYRWTMDGTIDRQGKVAVVMTHSYAGKIPYTFQLSRDGKRFSGTDIHWVRR